MRDRPTPNFYDVKRENIPTDVDFFIDDMNLAELLEQSEADRAARLEIIHSLVAVREVLTAERDAAELKLRAIRRFFLWGLVPARIKMIVARLARF